MNQDIGRAIAFSIPGQLNHDFARHNPLFQYGQPENTLLHDYCILSNDAVLERNGYAFYRP